jgi:hypothetical protein
MNELEHLIVFQLSYTRRPQTRSCLLPTHNIVNKHYIWFQGNSSNLRPQDIIKLSGMEKSLYFIRSCSDKYSVQVYFRKQHYGCRVTFNMLRSKQSLVWRKFRPP